MNKKLENLLEARKKSKEKGKSFSQPKDTKLKDMGPLKKGPSGSGPEGAKVSKPKSKNESVIPAFGARFQKLIESTLNGNQKLLEEDDAAELYNEFDETDITDNEVDVLNADHPEEETEVTITLSKDLARQLHSLLGAVIADDESSEEEQEFGDGTDDNEYKGPTDSPFESKEEDEDDDKEVVEEDGHYEQSNANLSKGEGLAKPGSKVVKSKLGARPGKAGNVKTHDSSGKLSNAPGYKKQDMVVKSNISSKGKDLF